MNETLTDSHSRGVSETTPDGIGHLNQTLHHSSSSPLGLHITFSSLCLINASREFDFYLTQRGTDVSDERSKVKVKVTVNSRLDAPTDDDDA